MPLTKSARYQAAAAAMLLFCLASVPAAAQGRRWVMPPDILGFDGAPSAPLPGSPPSSYRVANGVVDSSGNLLFYVVAAGSSGIEVYDRSGASIGSLPSSGNLSHQIALVPVPGHCSRYFVLYFSSHAFVGVDLYASVVDLDTKQILSSVVLATYNDNRGVLAVSRLRADGTRLLYALAAPRVQKFVIGPNGIALQSTLIDRIANPAQSAVNFFSTQAALSSDGTRLAWNDRLNDRIWVASLDPSGDLAAVAPLRSYTSGPVAGVAFSPDGTKLVFTTATFPQAGPISVIDLLASTPAVASLGASSVPYAGSLLQLAADGLIYAASPTDLGAIYPAIPSFKAGIVKNVVTGTLANSPIGGERTLPHQIDGEPQLTCEALCGNPALIQGNFGTMGNFEMIVPSPGGGMAHYWRANDTDRSWHGPNVFGTNIGTVDAVTLIQSTHGGGTHLEVVARAGDRLAHFWRDSAFAWHGPTVVFASGASGTPSLIQGNIGTPGNFELVTPLVTGGMAHYTRNSANYQWSGPVTFGTALGMVSDVALIQSTFGGGKNLEVVARAGDQLMHFWRDAALAWHGPTAFFASGVSGAPSLIQSRFGPGSFEVVAPRALGGMVHYQRNHQTFAWSGPAVFGGGNVRSVSLIQSNYGDNLEIVARVDCCLVHHWRDSTPSLAWSSPIPVVACFTVPVAAPLIAGCAGECGATFSTQVTVPSVAPSGCPGPQCGLRLKVVPDLDSDLCPNESVQVVVKNNGALLWDKTYTMDAGDPALGFVSAGHTDVFGTATVAPGDVLTVTAHTLLNGNQTGCKREGNFRFEITLLQ